MKSLAKTIISTMMLLMVGMQFALPAYVSAACGDGTGGLKDGIACTSPTDQAKGDLGANIRTITNTLVVVVIVAATIMVVIGGLRYTLSGGNSSATKEAKDQILYAVIGIIVALIAGGLVNFVVSKFVK